MAFGAGVADLIKSHQEDSLFLHFGLTSVVSVPDGLPILLVGWILFSQKDRNWSPPRWPWRCLHGPGGRHLRAGFPASRRISAGGTARDRARLHRTCLDLLITVTSQKIDVNRYSLHGIYRNRLVRGFLGAARRNREPNQFTGFDGEDNMRMCELDARVGKKRVLFPVINSNPQPRRRENLAWQERKASSFVITPPGVRQRNAR